MKLLIIAGPYEADRLRRAAVAAGFETVAVEPGESLSGWIAASRPDFIVMAPRMVHPDPAVALAKVRSVPSGRVPTFLVGESDDEPRMRGLGDGFFVRPVAPEDLLVEARRRVEQTRKPDSGAREMDLSYGHGRSNAAPRNTPSLRPLVVERVSGGPRHAQLMAAVVTPPAGVPAAGSAPGSPGASAGAGGPAPAPASPGSGAVPSPAPAPASPGSGAVPSPAPAPTSPGSGAVPSPAPVSVAVPLPGPVSGSSSLPVGGGASASSGVPMAVQSRGQSDELVHRISQSIDATLDAEIWEALRTVQALRRSESLARIRAEVSGASPDGASRPASSELNARSPSRPRIARPPSNATIARPPSNATIARPPSGATIACPPSGATIARPPSGAQIARPPTDPGRPSTDPMVAGFNAIPAAGHAERGGQRADDEPEDLRVATLLGPTLTATGEEDAHEPLPLSPEMAREAMAELADEASHKTVEAPRELFASVLAREEVTGVSAQDTEAESQLLYPTTGVVETSATRVSVEDMHLPSPESGSLAEHDLASLLGRAFVQQLTGHLELRREGARKVIFFEDGQPVQSTSNVADDRMVHMLLREGRLSPEQHAKGVETATATKRKMGAVLVDLGFIKQTELFPLVRRHYEQILYGLFAWEAGEWFLGPEGASPTEKIRLSRNPVALILEGISRKYTVERLRRLLGGDERIFRAVGLPGPDGLSQTGLTEDERRIAGLFDGVRTLREVQALAGAPAELVYSLAWALLVVDVLERVETTTAQRARAHWVGEDRERSIDRERVMQRHALAVDGDYFQVLGVTRDASTHEIRRAHESLVNEFSPGAFHSDLARDLATELQAIRDVLDEGLRVLGDENLRASYRAHLPAAAA